MDNQVELGTHIKFVPAPPKPKTKVWFVVSLDEKSHLGWVTWYGPWRKYCFQPKENTVYEWVCLREIADFCEKQTKLHKEQPATGEITNG